MKSPGYRLLLIGGILYILLGIALSIFYVSLMFVEYDPMGLNDTIHWLAFTLGMIAIGIVGIKRRNAMSSSWVMVIICAAHMGIFISMRLFFGDALVVLYAAPPAIVYFIGAYRNIY